jgi:hypothetical protein
MASLVRSVTGSGDALRDQQTVERISMNKRKLGEPAACAPVTGSSIKPISGSADSKETRL